MTRYDMKTRLLAASLSGLAGYVDAIGFLGTGGFFVSFMSGNSTRLAVGLAERMSFAITASALVAAFLLGVVAASLIARKARVRRQRAILIMVSVSLALAAATAEIAPSLLVFAMVAFAMGAENMLFEADGEVRIGLTYMTGTLVKIGQRLSVAFTGGERWGWVPFLLLWLGLIIGAVTGALAYSLWGLRSLWFAVAAASILALFVRKISIGGEAPTKARYAG
jgi:uncharacterized membrane protein YoaK (UPF0700 family)